MFVKPATVIVLDTVDGPAGEHRLEQWWHLGAAGEAARFSFDRTAKEVEAWRSRALCNKEAATALVVTVQARLPATMAMALDLSGTPESGPLEVRREGDAVVVARSGKGNMLARFE
jgi:hypothetical protein